MKILLVHNYYKEAGGEDRVVQLEKELLERHGHDVTTYYRSNDEIKGLWKIAKTLIQLSYSKKSKREFCEILKQTKPDVVHIHNFFMVITPSIVDACWESNIPVVMTLHNYRIVSPNAILFHKGRIDENSLQQSAYRCLFHRCYRRSIILTWAVARMIEYHRRRNTWNTRVTRFIVLTEFAKRKFIQGGIREERIAVKPNFIPPADLPSNIEKEDYYVFVGRLSEEKGLKLLLRSWRKIDKAIEIIGTGPLHRMVDQESDLQRNLHPRGFLPREETLRILSRAKALVFPSIWFEGFPMVLLEAFSVLTPVICSRIGGLPEIVIDEFNGLLFEPGSEDSLREVVARFENDPKLQRRLSLNCGSNLDRCSPEHNYQLLSEVYDRARKEFST